MSNPLLPPSAQTTGRVLVRVIFVALALLLAALLWVGIRGYLALGHVKEAQSLAQSVAENPTDTAAASSTVRRLQNEMTAAHRLTSDPVWKLGERLPYAGPQLSAVSEATSVLSAMSNQALLPLVDIAGKFSAEDLLPSDGRIDTTALVEVREVADESSSHMNVASRKIAAIDRRSLLPPLASAIDDLSTQVDQAARAVDGINRASQLLPKFLGEDEKRSYLVIAQNNSEWRSLGGLVGAMFVARTDNGKISIADYHAETDFERLPSPVVNLPKNMRELFSPNPAQYNQNVTQIPNFAESAQIAQAAWKHRQGEKVDGVIAIDPVTLAYILEATGPVTVPTDAFGGTKKVTSKNAVELLLKQVYIDYSTDEQDALFQATTSAVFDKIMAGGADPRALLSALSKASGERRILIWSDDKEEQRVLNGTKLQGSLPTSDETHAQFGIYVNDGTASKLSYYMNMETGATWCRESTHSGDVALQVTLRNNAPKDVASLPSSVVGSGYYGTEVGLTRNLAYLYLPEGSHVLSSDISGDGPLGGFGRGEHEGRSVLTWESVLAPGESATATIKVRTRWAPHIDIITTPTVPGNSTAVLPQCG